MHGKDRAQGPAGELPGVLGEGRRGRTARTGRAARGPAAEDAPGPPVVTVYAYRGGMPTLELPRCRLAYDVTGSGPPVAQLHGLPSDQSANTAGGLDLASGLTGCRGVRYDARGHGRSAAEPVAGDWAWPRLAQDLLHLLAEWPRRCADLVGAVEAGWTAGPAA
ncbi:alpha/beta fold hydrolase [Kocuria nitroreducens]|uniref:alpha/beta fold hydrolase n=1 Tax=Kocuria nitroreducens TaxID=3058914 RepID=UPI0036DAF57D